MAINVNFFEKLTFSCCDMSLTKHNEGSVRELWTLSFPLMLSSFSVLMMVFSDRWLLAHYSQDAHNAAVAATTFAWSFIFGWMTLAAIAEVFVSQYNGAGLRYKMGESVWQMIWLSFISCLFFIPLSYWGTELFFGPQIESLLERDYFSIMVLFGPFYVFYSALCGFFIGQGKTKLITSVVVCANIFNILMDWLLIFGVEGWIPSLGVKGAAIATSLATLFQGLILGIVFLNRKNRLECGTSSWKPRLNAMIECIKIGLPASLCIMIEFLAFGFYYMLMKEKGSVYITVVGICQAMFILFIFFAEGIGKATSAIVGNMIGSGRSFLIPKVLKAGMILNLCFLFVVMAFVLFAKTLIISQLLPLADPKFIEEISQPLQYSLVLCVFCLFFEGFRLQFAGILTASGDTFFLLATGASLVWICMLLPVYLFIAQGTAPVEVGALILVCYAMFVSLIYYWRIGRNQKLGIASLVDRA